MKFLTSIQLRICGFVEFGNGQYSNNKTSWVPEDKEMDISFHLNFPACVIHLYILLSPPSLKPNKLELVTDVAKHLDLCFKTIGQVTHEKQSAQAQ